MLYSNCLRSLVLIIIVGWCWSSPKASQYISLPPDGKKEGVYRYPVVLLGAKYTSHAADVVVTPDNQVAVVYVESKAGKEKIWYRAAKSPDRPLGKAVLVADGVRAWHPRLAVGNGGQIWLAWSGADKPPKKGEHTKDIYLRRLSANKLGKIYNISNSGGRSGNPDLAIGPEGVIHLVWEESKVGNPAQVRIAYRALDSMGNFLSPPRIISSGSFDRRPSICLVGRIPYVAFDRLVDVRASGNSDPDYDIFLISNDDNWANEFTVDRRQGIQAAADLVPDPEGKGILIAYHSSIPTGGLIKWWQLRKVQQGKIKTIKESWVDSSGVQQGAEFPVMLLARNGRIIVASRSSQGAYLQTIEQKGVSRPYDLSRHGWGARGMIMSLVEAKDGSVLLVRRARKAAVLERFKFSDRAAQKLEFVPVKDPIKQRPTITVEKKASVLFGDLHMHSAMSDGTGPADEIYARAWSRGHDFAVLTDHDYVVGSPLSPSERDEIVWLTDSFNARPGFTTLHGYEWTGKPMPQGPGHRNVYFRDHMPTKICSAHKTCPDTKSLLNLLSQEKAMVVPHHTGWTGTDWENADPSIQRLFEIVSVHGAFEYLDNKPILPRGKMAGMFARDGLARGLRYGFVGGSDGHGLLWHHKVGRKRDPWSQGLTGVIAEKNDRSSLFDALYARRTWATSGARIEAKINIANMIIGQAGDVVGPIEIGFEVVGAKAVLKIELIRDGQVVYRHESLLMKTSGRWIDHNVLPGEHSYYLRVIQGEGKKTDMAWTSPIFVNILPGT
jgi:hypothetical protein